MKQDRIASKLEAKMASRFSSKVEELENLKSFSKIKKQIVEIQKMGFWDRHDVFIGIKAIKLDLHSAIIFNSRKRPSFFRDSIRVDEAAIANKIGRKFHIPIIW